MIIWANGTSGGSDSGSGGDKDGVLPTSSAMIEYDDGDKEADVPRHMIHVTCV